MADQKKLFHLLFQEHLEQGLRADQKPDDPSRRRWKLADIACEAKVEPRTVTNWKNGSRTPDQEEFQRIVAVMFGNNPLHEVRRAAFEKAWKVAIDSRGDPGRRSKQKPKEIHQIGQKTNTNRTWIAQEPFVLRPGLGRVHVHRIQGATGADLVQDGIVALEVTAETGTVYETIEATEDTPRVSVTFAVTKARIVVTDTLNIEPVKGTTLGAEVSHPNVTFGSGWRLKVPIASDGLPDGLILAQDILRKYRLVESGLPYGIRIELLCDDIDLKSTDLTTLPDVSEKQRAMLRRYLQRDLANPDSATIVLARDELSGQFVP